jgi:hypothetical protein
MSAKVSITFTLCLITTIEKPSPALSLVFEGPLAV